MMSHLFNNLTLDENRQLIEAIPLIAILIAGADDEIDLNEKSWAEKIVKIRSYHNHFDLKTYYKEIDNEFSVMFEKFLAEFPSNADKRNEQISKQLSKLNAIFEKLPLRTASQIYSSFLAYAEQIARASGGFLRMMSISREESIWIGLPMLDPIFYDEFDEEE